MNGLDDLLSIASSIVRQPLPAEPCALEAADGRILAEAICADRDLPPFDRAAMDGFALRHGEAAASMPMAGRIDAGADTRIDTPPGACIGIATGARVPEDLDTVVQHEWTGGAAATVDFKRMAQAGANIHPRGADARRGDVLVQAGDRIDVVAAALAAACGRTDVSVRRRPRIAICTSGDEIVPVNDTPAAHQIRNSNGRMLEALVMRLGGALLETGHLSDDADAVLSPLADLIAPADVIVTTGGISAGERDVIAAALDDLGVTWSLIGALVQPGRPVRLGMVGETAVVCLPGNPVSALVMGTLVLGRLCAALAGAGPPSWSPAPLAHGVEPNPRRELLRPCRLVDGRIHVPRWQGSGDLAHAAGTQGLVRLPMQEDPLPEDTVLPVLRWP